MMTYTCSFLYHCILKNNSVNVSSTLRHTQKNIGLTSALLLYAVKHYIFAAS